jgi:hypothetical protein
LVKTAGNGVRLVSRQKLDKDKLAARLMHIWPHELLQPAKELTNTHAMRFAVPVDHVRDRSSIPTPSQMIAELRERHIAKRFGLPQEWK